MISTNDSNLGKSIQGSQRMQRVSTHGLNERINQWPYQGTPFGVSYGTTSRYRRPKLPRMPGIAGFAANVTCTRSTHVYRAPTVSQARRQGDHGVDPQGKVSGLPQQPRRGEEGVPDVTALQNDTSKSKAEPCNPQAIHHLGIWGGGGSALPEASAKIRRTLTPPNSTPKPSREAKLTGGPGNCHRGEPLALAKVQLLANPLTLAQIC